MDDAAVDTDLNIVDFGRGLTVAQKEKIVPVATVDPELIAKAQRAYRNYGKENAELDSGTDSRPTPCTVYEHKDFPGQ